MLGPQWTGFFESDDPGVTHYPVEVRYPFLDLRIVNYLFAIPVFPWAYKKKLLRDSMFKKLPEMVRLRRKTPILVDPITTKIEQSGNKCINSGPPSAHAAEFLDLRRLANSYRNIGPEEIRAYCLEKWLRGIR